MTKYPECWLTPTPLRAARATTSRDLSLAAELMYTGERSATRDRDQRDTQARCVAYSPFFSSFFPTLCVLFPIFAAPDWVVFRRGLTVLARAFCSELEGWLGLAGAWWNLRRSWGYRRVIITWSRERIIRNELSTDGGAKFITRSTCERIWNEF